MRFADRYFEVRMGKGDVVLRLDNGMERAFDIDPQGKSEQDVLTELACGYLNGKHQNLDDLFQRDALTFAEVFSIVPSPFDDIVRIVEEAVKKPSDAVVERLDECRVSLKAQSAILASVSVIYNNERTPTVTAIYPENPFELGVKVKEFAMRDVSTHYDGDDSVPVDDVKDFLRDIDSMPEEKFCRGFSMCGPDGHVFFVSVDNAENACYENDVPLPCESWEAPSCQMS